MRRLVHFSPEVFDILTALLVAGCQVWKHGLWHLHIHISSPLTSSLPAICYGHLRLAPVLAFELTFCRRFENVDDPRLSDSEFYCYPCRVICGDAEALLDSEREVEIDNALNDLRSLSLFRRGESFFAVAWSVSNEVLLSGRDGLAGRRSQQIGRASCRERVS